MSGQTTSGFDNYQSPAIQLIKSGSGIDTVLLISVFVLYVQRKIAMKCKQALVLFIGVKRKICSLLKKTNF